MTAGKVPSDEEIIFGLEFLTVAQVAKWARVSTKTVYRWIQAGKIPAIRFGERTYRIPTRAVIEYLKSTGYSNLIPSTKLT
jgi:excisionase family DNA binding protein